MPVVKKIKAPEAQVKTIASVNADHDDIRQDIMPFPLPLFFVGQNAVAVWNIFSGLYT